MTAGNTNRDDIRRDDLAEILDAAENSAPDGDLPNDAEMSNRGIHSDVLAEASRGTGDVDDDIPEHLWPSRGVDSLSEYTRHASEDPQEAIERLPLDENDVEPIDEA